MKDFNNYPRYVPGSQEENPIIKNSKPCHTEKEIATPVNITIVNENEGINFTPGDNLELTADGILNVLTANEVEADNTRPITAAAVHTQIGNIEVLLSLV